VLFEHVGSRGEIRHDGDFGEVVPGHGKQHDVVRHEAQHLVRRRDRPMIHLVENGSYRAQALESTAAERQNVLAVRRRALSEDANGGKVSFFDFNSLLTRDYLLDSRFAFFISLSTFNPQRLQSREYTTCDRDPLERDLGCEARVKR